LNVGRNTCYKKPRRMFSVAPSTKRKLNLNGSPGNWIIPDTNQTGHLTKQFINHKKKKRTLFRRASIRITDKMQTPSDAIAVVGGGVSPADMTGGCNEDPPFSCAKSKRPTRSASRRPKCKHLRLEEIPPPVQKLPVEIIALIFGWLPWRTLMHARAVCRSWRCVASGG
jgi:hypothetical protein